MRRFIKWSLGVILVLMSVVVVVFLPEYIAVQEDKEYVNRYQLYEQDTSDAVYVDLALSEKIELLLLPEKSEGNNICVIQTSEPEVVLESNADLFEELEKQMKQLEEKKLIPTVSTQFDMQKDMGSAELYARTSNKHPGSVLYVWDIYFIREDGVECSVTMDANTYKIYEFYTSGVVVELYAETYHERMDAVGGEFYELYWQWFHDYADYLQNAEKSNAQNAQDSGTDVLELKWNGNGSFGWMQTDEIGWNLHLYLDFEYQSFSYRISDAYEYDTATSYSDSVVD